MKINKNNTILLFLYKKTKRCMGAETVWLTVTIPSDGIDTIDSIRDFLHFILSEGCKVDKN